MIVTDEAFDELLDRVEGLAEETPPGGTDDDVSEDDPVVLRRDQFALAVDRAVTNVLARTDHRVWYAQTLRRFGCRLHFFRSAGIVYLVACIDSDDEDDAIEDHST